MPLSEVKGSCDPVLESGEGCGSLCRPLVGIHAHWWVLLLIRVWCIKVLQYILRILSMLQVWFTVVQTQVAVVILGGKTKGYNCVGCTSKHGWKSSWHTFVIHLYGLWVYSYYNLIWKSIDFSHLTNGELGLRPKTTRMSSLCVMDNSIAYCRYF